MSDYVLVVDDDPDVRGLLVDALGMMDLNSRVAVNGAQALEIVEEEPPAAIVLDLMMPVMDGFNTLINLRRKQASAQIPVILLSAVADYDQNVHRLPGVAGVLCKGRFSISELCALMMSVGLLAEDWTPNGRVA